MELFGTSILGLPQNNWELFNTKAIDAESNKYQMIEVEKRISYLTEGDTSYKAHVSNNYLHLGKLFGFADYFASKLQKTILRNKILFLVSLFFFTAFLEAAENLPEHTSEAELISFL